MYIFNTQIRVRYAETDQMGYVYYGNYAMYYEVARTESLRNLGVTYKELEEFGVMLPVADLQIKYIKPAFYDDLLTIKVSIAQLPKVKIAFDYEVLNEKQELLQIGGTTLVFVNIKTGRPCRMPQMMQTVLDPFFEDEAKG